jgi:hypothetical protein
MKHWRSGFAVVFGATVGLALFTLVYLITLFASDLAPRLMLRWTPVALAAGGVASGIVGLVAALFVTRAMSGPAIARRIGGGLAALGVFVIMGGVALFFAPLKPPLLPGQMPAGDIAAGAMSLLVVYSGIMLIIVGVLVGFVGLIHSPPLSWVHCFRWVQRFV